MMYLIIFLDLIWEIKTKIHLFIHIFLLKKFMFF